MRTRKCYYVWRSALTGKYISAKRAARMDPAKVVRERRQR